MSVAIAIGNDTQDIVNIQNTINLLQSIADSSSSFETLSSEDIDNLIDWYKGIINILLDPSLFSYDESHSSM
jgi:hypothetical protein